MTGGDKSHVTDSADFGNFCFGGHSMGRYMYHIAAKKKNICGPIFLTGWTTGYTESAGLTEKV